MKLTTCQGSAQCLTSGRGPLSWLFSECFVAVWARTHILAPAPLSPAPKAHECTVQGDLGDIQIT